MRPGSKVLFPPIPGELTAGHSVDDQTGIRSTRAAVYGGAGSTIDWVLASHLSDGGRGITASLRDISLVFISVDGEDVYETVGLNGRSEGDDCSKEREE